MTGVYLSKDFGRTWKNIFVDGAGAEEPWYYVAISVDGNTLLAVQQYLGLYVSTNGGASWTRSIVDSAIISPYFSGLACSAYGSTVIVSISQNIYYSTNYGRTFSKSSSTGSSSYFLAVSQSGTSMFATSSSVSRSTDGGYSWRATSLPQGNWNSVAMSFDGSRIVAAAGADQYSNYHMGGIYTSQDGGNSWLMTSAPTNLNWKSVASDQSGQYLQAAAAGAGIYRSTDFGKSWYLTSAPTAQWKTITVDSSGMMSAVGLISGTSTGKIMYATA